MSKASDDKVRFNYSMPALLYARLEADSRLYGIAKSNIVNCALLDYYKTRDSLQETSE